MKRLFIGSVLSTMFMACGVSAMELSSGVAGKKEQMPMLVGQLVREVIQKMGTESKYFGGVSDETRVVAQLVQQLAEVSGNQKGANRIFKRLKADQNQNNRQIQNRMNPALANKGKRKLNFDDVAVQDFFAKDEDEPAEKKRRFNPDEDAIL